MGFLAVRKMRQTPRGLPAAACRRFCECGGRGAPNKRDYTPKDAVVKRAKFPKKKKTGKMRL
ncbi:MAG: hypothetical protein ACR2P5_04590 [Gammaproteobacteria bacterium]